MIRLLLLFLFLIATPARAAVWAEGVQLDPSNQIRPLLLTQALNALQATPHARRDLVAVVDFEKSSKDIRFYIVDLKTGAVEGYRTAHGQGSDRSHDGMAEFFSNDDGTHASSLGVYRTGARYFGKHGLSLALDGLDPTNSNARSRAIVVHSAAYMEEGFVAAHNRPGRSWGCFVVEPRFVEHVVERLENGAIIFAGR